MSELQISDLPESEIQDNGAGQDDGTGEVPAEKKPPANSLLARIAAERDERLADESLLLPIPTWDGNLVASYVVVDADEFRRRVESSKSDTDANVRFLVDALKQLHLRDEEGKLVLVEDELGPVGFDMRLAELLGIEADTAREVVLNLVGGNVLALNSHSLKVLAWMQDTSQEVEGAIVGESLG